MKSKENDHTNIVTKSVCPLQLINSLEELKAFNEQLNDQNIFNEYFERLSFICGANSRVKAIDNCYMLVDKFFTRNFFTLCSWAGGAKVPNSKFPFKFYENVISLFFKLINTANSNFTWQDCEDFFKNVIRNSARRSQSNSKRASKSKNRPKKSNYEELKDKNLENEENNTE
ncbi:unnamed protein product, partial [Callosobruchus maculatus]